MTAAPKSVLVLRFHHLGDVLLISGPLSALRRAWPKARIVVATEARWAPLLRNHPAVDDIVERGAGEGDIAYARRLKDLGAEALLDLHGFARNLLLRRLVPAHRKAVWRKRPLLVELAVRLRLRTYRAHWLTADKYHQAVERLVGGPVAPEPLRYYLAAGDEEKGRRALAAAGLDPLRPIVGMAPGANQETKRWPVEHFAGLAERLFAAGNQIAITGTTAEAPLARSIVARVPRAADLMGTLDLPTLGGVIASLRAFVANDSGPMHIARGLGVPTLAVFGSTDPGMFSFQGHAVLFAGLDCQPCSLWGLSACPLGHFRCMRDPGPDEAWRSLEPLLTRGRIALVRG